MSDFEQPPLHWIQMVQNATHMYEQGVLPDPLAQRMEEGDNWDLACRLNQAIDNDPEIQHRQGITRGYTPIGPSLVSPPVDPSPVLPRQVNVAPPPQHLEPGSPHVGPSSNQNSRLVARTFAVYRESHEVD